VIVSVVRALSTAIRAHGTAGSSAITAPVARSSRCRPARPVDDHGVAVARDRHRPVQAAARPDRQRLAARHRPHEGPRVAADDRQLVAHTDHVVDRLRTPEGGRADDEVAHANITLLGLEPAGSHA